MRPLFIRGVKTIDIARRAEAERERQRRYAAKRRQEEAARVAAERKAQEEEEHEQMVRAYNLGSKLWWLARVVRRDRTFEKACKIADILPEVARKLLQKPPTDEWGAFYVGPEVEYLRRRLAGARVEWQ
jgi:hypothetical protein